MVRRKENEEEEDIRVRVWPVSDRFRVVWSWSTSMTHHRLWKTKEWSLRLPERTRERGEGGCDGLAENGEEENEWGGARGEREDERLERVWGARVINMGSG
ncbi:hypothetical protein HAX54_006227 [Datura stramonium]|uniref:Uncharacterized protein n=1 Tax=Datura stramonium TaxID=4076 RepID=A0ABS8RV09_DATST|nr:hypothetical protein [Datura stramonium]